MFRNSNIAPAVGQTTPPLHTPANTLTHGTNRAENGRKRAADARNTSATIAKKRRMVEDVTAMGTNEYTEIFFHFNHCLSSTDSMVGSDRKHLSRSARPSNMKEPDLRATLTVLKKVRRRLSFGSAAKSPKMQWSEKADTNGNGAVNVRIVRKAASKIPNA